MKNFYYLIFLVGLLMSCDQKTSAIVTSTEKLADSTFDDHSYSNLREIHTKHLDLELEVNFQNKTIYGVARHTMKNNNTDTAIFDINGLLIQKVTLGTKNHEKETDFVIGNMDKDSILGQPLLVTTKNKTQQINIYYQTTENSAALDWLDSNLTSSKTKPFLYTQGQAILTRTWIPIQDSPSNRITYSAKVSVPDDLIAVMSAKNEREKSSDGNYFFEMKKPIPSYLIALAVGDLSYQSLGPNTGFYCEPELAKACLYEFQDLPKMMQAAEKIYGKYQWDQYDLLVLPYSFPFGGMENPMLTFVNPTIITGDRSLTSVVAHELAHSWSGNLVTNRTWNDFWLNEGFTVYFEQRIMEELYGKDVSDILAAVEYYELQDELKTIAGSNNPEDSRLFLNLKGRNPDDGLTDIAYVKGSFFLKTLEQKVGRIKFDEFINTYFQKYAFKTISSAEFVAYLEKNLLSRNKIDFNHKEWIYKEGLPKNCLQIKSVRLDKMNELANKFAQGEAIFKPVITYEKIRIKGRNKKNRIVNKLERKDFIVQEWQTFIRALPKSISKEKLKIIDIHLGFKNCGNSEIMTEWFTLALENNYTELNSDIERFLKKVGRRKYLVPIYKAMNKVNPKLAKQIFENSKNQYHAVSRNSIEELLKKAN
jgi:leukotriene-A4 hydrolase